MEICSGTDLEPEVLKLMCLNYQKTYDKFHNYIEIHIMEWIRNLHNMS